MEKVIIFGASLFGELCHYCLSHDTHHEVVAFTVDREFITKDKLFGLPVIPFSEIESSFPPSEFKMIIPLSFQKVNRLREEKYVEAKNKGYKLMTYISSKSTTWPDIAIGENCFIGANSLVEPFAKLGNNVTVASSCMIGHHAVLNDHCFIAPGAVLLGGTNIGAYSLIGANATIKEGVRIAPECIIAAGVSITKDTMEKGVYINKSPELLPKTSDQLRDWLSWPVDPAKARWGKGTKQMH